jgi:hypothetical protein
MCRSGGELGAKIALAVSAAGVFFGAKPVKIGFSPTAHASALFTRGNTP